MCINGFVEIIVRISQYKIGYTNFVYINLEKRLPKSSNSRKPSGGAVIIAAKGGEDMSMPIDLFTLVVVLDDVATAPLAVTLTGPLGLEVLLEDCEVWARDRL